MWVEAQPSAQLSFQKLNVDNSCQKTRKIRYYVSAQFKNLSRIYCISLVCAKYFGQDCSIISHYFNPIQDVFFWCCSRMEGEQKKTLPKMYHIYPTMMNHVTHPLSSVDTRIFSPEINKFCFIKKYGRYSFPF